MKKTERFRAALVLKTVLQQKIPLSHAMQKENTLTPLAKEICFGVLRYYLRLERLALSLLNKRQKDFDVWISLLMGLYELTYLNTPEYAVVHETVALLEQFKKNWAKSFVNAILRRYCRERQDIDTSDAEEVIPDDNHPAWLVKQIKHDWPKAWQAILAANDERPPMSLRVNQRLSNVQDYLACLKKIGHHAEPHPFAPDAIILSQALPVTELPGFADGHVSVQDCAAQLASLLLDLKPGLRVLDACCAPGGKTAHMLEIEANLKACLALDIDSKRLQRVQENLARLKCSATLIKGDALKTSLWWDGVAFDRILLDAPCSATGVVRRHPDIKLLRTAEEILQIATIQERMLHTLWPLLVPGGRLVYATCSIMSLENEHQIAQFVSQHSDCQVDQSHKPWGQWTGHGWQILPGEHRMDGFFYSVLIKTE